MMRKYGFLLGFTAFALLSSGVAAQSDLAPTPRKSPRVPVSQQKTFEGKKVQIPASRIVSGQATVIDTEKVKIGEIEMRLFGVVPPQLSASFGPQARSVLDKMTADSATTCAIRDRDRDGRFLATCKDGNGADLAVELLRRGLALTARGSLRPTELAEPYEAAESAAESQRIGLWSVNPPAAAPIITVDKKSDVSLVAVSSKQENEQAETQKTEISPPAPPQQIFNEKQAVANEIQSSLPEDVITEDVYEQGFFVKYQILITGVLMLLAALSIVFAVLFQRWREKKDEIKSIAAAIRGELMAARSICQARLKSMPDGAEEKGLTWPRIRITVFQAYVGRLGQLGSTLARQVSSIYGQTSDYAAYYGASLDGKSEKVSKRRALQMLVQHIEEVLPKLARIETGKKVSVESGSSNRLEYKNARPLTLEPPIAREIRTPEQKKQTEESKQKETDISETKANREKTETNVKTTSAEKPKEPESKKEPLTANPKTEAAPLWDKIRKFATEHMDNGKKISVEDVVPDYTNMTEEEIEALAYSEIFEEEDASLSAESGKKKSA